MRNGLILLLLLVAVTARGEYCTQENVDRIMNYSAELDTDHQKSADQYNAIINANAYQNALFRRFSAQNLSLYLVTHRPQIQHHYAEIQTLIRQANSVEYSVKKVSKTAEKAREYWNQLARYCDNENDNLNYKRFSRNSEVMASAVKELTVFQSDISKLKNDLQRESSFILRAALDNISWHSLPTLSSQLSDGWALSGRFRYQVDNSLCESFDLLAVALMSGDLQYTHEIPPSRLDTLSVALSERTDSGSWRSPFSSEPNGVPQHLSQLSIMWIPMQLFVIPVENCASELATLMSNDWLTFVMAMEGGGEVYSHGKLSLPQESSNQESTIQSATVAETSATLSHRSESEYLMALSSLRLLTQEELQGYNSQELRLMRNEIFARHGYRFKSQELTRFFSEKSWYKPTTTEVTLSSIEAENVKLIKSLE